MSDHYVDYGYVQEDHPSGAGGRALASLFVGTVEGLGGIGSIAELGCGNGFLSGRLGERGFHVTGADASASGIAIARRAHAGGKVRFLQGEIAPELAEHAMAGERFDAVVSSDVIEHMYRPRLLVETAAALLGPGGYLVLGTPYHGYLKNLAISVVDGWDTHHGVHWDGGHIKFFSVKTLAALVQDGGFEVLRFLFHGRVRWLWKNMICIARKT